MYFVKNQIKSIKIFSNEYKHGFSMDLFDKEFNKNYEVCGVEHVSVNYNRDYVKDLRYQA